MPVFLIVDDLQEQIMMLQAVLGSLFPGSEVWTARSYDQAMDVLGEVRIDLVLADYALGGRTGSDLLSQQGMPLGILVTAREAVDLPEGMLLVRKPYRPTELADVIRQVLASTQ